MFSNLRRKCLSQGKVLPAFQLRYYRKPRWLPMAKSKLFRIPVRPVIPLEELNELKRIHFQYHTQMRAMRNFFYEEFHAEQESIANIDSKESKREKTLDFARCVAENDAWNAEVAKLREARMLKEREERDHMALEKVEYRQQLMNEKIQEAEALVQKQMEQSKTFITRENIDDAINKALAFEVCHNFAIDLQGNILKSQKIGAPKEDEPETIESVS